MAGGRHLNGRAARHSNATEHVTEHTWYPGKLLFDTTEPIRQSISEFV